MSGNTEWNELAQFWIKRCCDGEANREGMLDRWMLRAVGQPEHLSVIDLGCGEGRFSRMLSRLGADRVLGIDTCEAFIQEAGRMRRLEVEEYRLDNMEHLETVSDEEFDMAVSYLSLVDVQKLSAAIQETFRILKKGGRFIVCNLAPMATAVNKRIEDPDRSRIAIRVDNYFDESVRIMRFGEHQISNYHRTLSHYLNIFLTCGFVLKGFEEPFPSNQELLRYPELENELRAPSFVIYKLEKPNSRPCCEVRSCPPGS
jgi:2-polyprenyl-3-methyl-5-hydroxy-6-metoxy-1,4-benzoquinol methylase